MPSCGVLALQGDWAAHSAVLERLGVAPLPVRTAADLEQIDAVVVPGGESTAMLHLLEYAQMTELLRERIRGGLPVFGTCAGAILLAREVKPQQPTLADLDVTVVRNAYGRQLASRVVSLRVGEALGGAPEMNGVFIRAPRIERVGAAVTELAWRDDDPVLVRSGSLLAATFHPELTDDSRLHRYFIHAVAGW